MDDRLSENVELHCFGGFVVTTLYGLMRSTADVDVLPAIKRSAWRHLADFAGKGSELHRRYGIYPDFVTVATVPEDYDQLLGNPDREDLTLRLWVEAIEEDRGHQDAGD